MKKLSKVARQFIDDEALCDPSYSDMEVKLNI